MNRNITTATEWDFHPGDGQHIRLAALLVTTSGAVTSTVIIWFTRLLLGW
jgi:hypothetical protein